MVSKIEKCQVEMQNAFDMLEVSNAVIANFQDQPHTQQEDSHPPDRQSIQVLAPHKDQLKSLEDMNSHFFFCVLGSFDPPCVRSPLNTLESGVLFHIWWLSKQLIV